MAQYKGTYSAYIGAIATEAPLTAELGDHRELSIWDGDNHVVDLEISDRSNRNYSQRAYQYLPDPAGLLSCRIPLHAICHCHGPDAHVRLLIHLSGGRIETHFQVFGSLAFLAFYRDWRVMIPATLVVAADHFIRGVYFPQSVFGILIASHWRWVQHAAWVIFEDFFLIISCLRSVREMKGIASPTAELELSKEELRGHREQLEERVRERTAELSSAKEKAEIASQAKSEFLATT